LPDAQGVMEQYWESNVWISNQFHKAVLIV